MPDRALVLVVTILAAVLVVVRPSTAPAVGLPNPTAAKAADACQRAIAKAGPAFAAATSKSLEKCYDGLFKCLQTKSSDPSCLAKAIATCGVAVATKAPQARAKLAAAIAKKCGSFSDLTSADGLGYQSLMSECQTDFGTTLTNVSTVSECIRAQHECRAELAFSVAMPRAGQLAADLVVPTRAGSCIPNRGGSGDVGDPKGLGKALEVCQKAIKQSGAKLAAAQLKSLGKCVTTAFGCAQTKPNDAKCRAKAQAACDKAVAVDIPKAEATLRAAIGKRCLPVFADLSAPNALNVGALAPICQSRGVASLATLDDLTACILRQYTCTAEDELRFQVPRAAALLSETGHTLMSAFCGPTPTPTVMLTATSTVTATPTATASATPTLTSSATPTLTATPTVTSTPTLTTTPTVTLTPTPTVTLTPTPTVTFTPAPGEVRLSVTRLGGGTGVVTFDPLGVTCGSTCEVSIAPGTTITLQARTQNGASSYFQGFAGGGCNSARDCVIQVNADTTVDATFAAQDFNLVFVTSGTYPSDLNSTFPYDGACNDAATEAGINNVAGNAYVAWLSDTSSTAPARLGSARGFVRLDGKPFTDTLAGLLTGEVRNSLRIDETGREITSSLGVRTGTTPNGGTATGSTCSDWASDMGTQRIGRASDGPDSWTSFVDGGCVASRLYCFMSTRTAALPTTPVNGKLAFFTNAPFEPGSGDPDARCAADKPAGAGTVVALLARSTAAAATHLDPQAVYVRPDGQVVGTGQQLIDAAASTDRVESGFWQGGNAAYAGVIAWTGATNLTAVPTTSATCGDWAVTTGSGQTGTSSHTTSTYWAGFQVPCNSDSVRLYCVEQ